MAQWLKRMGGFLLSFTGSILLAIGMHEEPEIMVPLGAVFLAWGLVLFFSSRRQYAPLPLAVPFKHERALLRLAQQRGGRLTTPEVALELGLSLAEAKTILDSLVLNGYANYVSEEGQVVYRLFLSPMAEKPSLLKQLRDRTMGQLPASMRDREQELVQLAMRRRGRLTAAEVTAQMGVSLDDAKNWLDSLAERGHLGYEVTEDGRIVYRLTEPVDAIEAPAQLRGPAEAERPAELPLRRGEE